MTHDHLVTQMSRNSKDDLLLDRLLVCLAPDFSGHHLGHIPRVELLCRFGIRVPHEVLDREHLIPPLNEPISARPSHVMSACEFERVPKVIRLNHDPGFLANLGDDSADLLGRGVGLAVPCQRTKVEASRICLLYTSPSPRDA